MYRRETKGEVLSQDFVLGLPSTTSPCPVNFMLSSPQANLRQRMDARVWLVSVTDGVKQRTRRCFLFRYDLLLYPFREPNSQSNYCRITYRIKPLSWLFDCFTLYLVSNNTIFTPKLAQIVYIMCERGIRFTLLMPTVFNLEKLLLYYI